VIRRRVRLEPAQHEEIRRLAHRHRIAISAAVRRLVTEVLGVGFEEASRPRASELCKAAGIGRSGVPDLGRRHDDYLAEDYRR
jgi:hypothetical protein